MAARIIFERLGQGSEKATRGVRVLEDNNRDRYTPRLPKQIYPLRHAVHDREGGASPQETPSVTGQPKLNTTNKTEVEALRFPETKPNGDKEASRRYGGSIAFVLISKHTSQTDVTPRKQEPGEG